MVGRDLAIAKALDTALPILLTSLEENRKKNDETQPTERMNNPDDEDEDDLDYDYESDDSYKARPRKKGKKRCPYKAFKDGNPPKFEGTKDATITNQWIREIEAVIKISECRDDQKVKYAAHSFVSEALCWWENLVIALGDKAIDRMTWEELKRLLIEEFCPDNEMDKLERNFLRLKAGSMTHREYNTKFNRMARLVPHLITPESVRIKRYVQGLPSKIRRLVKTSDLKTFRSTIQLASTMYDEVFGSRHVKSKRKWSDISKNQNKRNGGGGGGGGGGKRQEQSGGS
ncbi:hypothetical protein L1987_54373 [Smallanthus sonchifolius]|uniref:Uncharacterized protein n=1 Tax=Smallanthus sonchifolius TaxID=185202 RepID=A0ACB9E815_9ASTR|nr:hypothetical protein L1987_54373 [Smallanthus sonchifolius]